MAIIRTKKLKHKNLRCSDIEIAIAYYFGITSNLMVPNVSYGMFSHECDLIKLTGSNICSEIEIKISIQDMKNDLKKKHLHKDKLIHELYFAIPDYLKDNIDLIPLHAGILIVKSDSQAKHLPVECIRRAKRDIKIKWTIDDKIRLLRLSTMRIWNLKIKLREEKEKYDRLYKDKM